MSSVRAGQSLLRNTHMELIVSSFIAAGALLLGHLLALVRNRLNRSKA